jgi:hypothetical protein
MKLGTRPLAVVQFGFPVLEPCTVGVNLGMANTRELRSRGSESVTNWYCNSCSWSVTVINGKAGEPSKRDIQSEFSSFASRRCSESYGQKNAAENSKQKSLEDVNPVAFKIVQRSD